MTDKKTVIVGNIGRDPGYTVAKPLTVCGVTIRQDAEGRYCLNDLHRAAGRFPKDKPDRFLETESACNAVQLLKAGKPAFNPVSITRGKYGGTYVAKRLVYKYAIWISAEFEAKVIDAFDALATGDIAGAVAIAGTKQAHEGLELAIISAVGQLLPTMINAAMQPVLAMIEARFNDAPHAVVKDQARALNAVSGTYEIPGKPVYVVWHDKYGDQFIPGATRQLSTLMRRRNLHLDKDGRVMSKPAPRKGKTILFNPSKVEHEWKYGTLKSDMDQWLYDQSPKYVPGPLQTSLPGFSVMSPAQSKH